MSLSWGSGPHGGLYRDRLRRRPLGHPLPGTFRGKGTAAPEEREDETLALPTRRISKVANILVAVTASTVVVAGIYAALFKENDALLGHLLSWPVALLVVALLLRPAIQNLLTREGLESLKLGAGGFEAKWVTERLEAAKHDLQGSSAAPPTGSDPENSDEDTGRSTSFISEMATLAEVSPRSVILETFARLERVMRDVMEPEAEPTGRRDPRYRVAMRRLVEAARREGLLTSQEYRALLEIVSLRNAVAHDSTINIDRSQALDFTKIARQIAIALRLASGQTFDAFGDPFDPILSRLIDESSRTDWSAGGRTGDAVGELRLFPHVPERDDLGPASTRQRRIAFSRTILRTIARVRGQLERRRTPALGVMSREVVPRRGGESV